MDESMLKKVDDKTLSTWIWQALMNGDEQALYQFIAERDRRVAEHKMYPTYDISATSGSRST